jgi:uncharacterized protein YehS (DUF1456 family)
MKIVKTRKELIQLSVEDEDYIEYLTEKEFDETFNKNTNRSLSHFLY